MIPLLNDQQLIQRPWECSTLSPATSVRLLIDRPGAWALCLESRRSQKQSRTFAKVFFLAVQPRRFYLANKSLYFCESKRLRCSLPAPKELVLITKAPLAAEKEITLQVSHMSVLCCCWSPGSAPAAVCKLCRGIQLLFQIAEHTEPGKNLS